MPIRELFNELISVIETASISAREYFDSNDFSNEQKEDGSVVTKIDQEMEAAIRSFIQTHFREDAIIGEEEADISGTSGFVWHIDPIDGTDNFLRKIPFCAVSVARLGDTEEGSFAIVHNPITRHTFSAFESSGVLENGHAVHCYPEPLSGKYVIGLGRGKKEPWMKPAAFKIIERLGSKYGRCMPYNCTALELAYVSAGRIDGFLTYGLSSYDYAAGLYLARKAGAVISVHDGAEWFDWQRSIKDLCSEHGRMMFVSHADIHHEMLAEIGNPRTLGAS